MIINRRGFIAGLAALITAPAIVRAGSLMPVKQMIETIPDGEMYRVIEVITSSNGTIEVGLSRLGDYGLKARSGSFMTTWDNPHIVEVGGINIGDYINIMQTPRTNMDRYLTDE